MGRVKYNHIPGNVYLTEWIDYDGNKCHCIHLVVQVKPGPLGGRYATSGLPSPKLSDQKYALFCVYSRHTKSGFSTTARWCGRNQVNYLAKQGLDLTKRRLEVVLLFGTTLGKLFGKALERYRKFHQRYTTKLDCDLIESLIPK